MKVEEKAMIHNGDLEIRNSDDAAKYKDVREIAGDVYIESNGMVDAPKLQAVGGSIYIASGAILNELYAKYNTGLT